RTVARRVPRRRGRARGLRPRPARDDGARRRAGAACGHRRPGCWRRSRPDRAAARTGLSEGGAMAFGRLERNPGAQPMSDINMTPLIDVMLVLLVIFMITAPLMTSSLKLDLPKTDAAQPSDTPQFISVALDRDGRYFYGDEAVDAAAFAARIAAAAKKNPQTEVQLRADKAVPYGRVAELIGIVQKAGLTRIGFIADPEKARRAAPGR